MKPIIPEDERSEEPLDTERIIYHPDMIKANEWVLNDYEAPLREVCIFVPCAKRKPYHESPSHKKFDRIIFGIAAYLEKTRANYRHRIAYCIGDFRTAMEKALEMVDIKVDIVPRESTIQRMIQPDKAFIYNSLSSKEYLQDFSDAITTALKLPAREVGLREDMSVDDTDWYVL